MKEIKIKFVDEYDGYDYKKDTIYQILIKHFKVTLSDDPDYIVCSVYSDDSLDYNCIKIFYTGENLVPDFNLFDYAIGFEYMSVGDRYIRFPNYLNTKYAEVISQMETKHLNVVETLKEKTDFCSFVYSNTQADEMRGKIFDELSEYKRVNSGGRFLNNIGEPVKDKVIFEKKHKFSIVCENSSHPGYTTEKLVQSFAAGTIPIYWGDPEISRVFNKNSFINVKDYNSLSEMREKVKEIDNDNELYTKMLSEPALVESGHCSLSMNELEGFLVHIFEQTYNETFRRNIGFWGDEVYLKKLKKWKKAYAFSFDRIIHGVRNRIQKILK